MTLALSLPTVADSSEALQIAERIWWVGCRDDERGVRRHAYLIEQGDQSVLVNPGSRRSFWATRARIAQILPLDRIRWFVCLEPDPDVASGLPLIDKVNARNDAAVLAHGRTCALLRHYDLSLPLLALETYDWRLQLEDRSLEFVFTPYVRAAGAVCAFDRRTGVLFPAGLFASPEVDDRLIATEEAHLDGMVACHERQMPSSEALDYALAQIERLPIRLVAPQRGPLIPQTLVTAAIERLRHLKCGIFLLADGETDVQQAWQLGDTVRRISEAMLLYPDFGDIAKQLLELIQPVLPADRIEYHALMPDGSVLTLNPETRFVGVTDDQRPELCAFLGRSREDWLNAHAQDPGLWEHRLHDARFCAQPAAPLGSDGDVDGLVITLPLCARGQNLIDAVAVIHLAEPLPITGLAARLIARIAEPLQVALERETIYRSLDLERERAYQRSIHDPLTGLFTRVYMQDVVSRQCMLHARDAAATLCACLLDLDHFKAINDAYGHATGDRVLATTAAILRSNCRSTDIPVRYGGEEFLLFTIGQDIEGATALAERLRSLISSEEIDAGGDHELRVTVSIGVAEHRPEEGLEELLRRADAALYRAKRLGRDRTELAE